MHTFKRTIVIIAAVLLAAGCNFTDPDNLTFQKDIDVYTNLNKLTAVLTRVYDGLPDGYSDVGASWLAAACDEAEEVNNQEGIQNFNVGNISPYSNPDDVWSKMYQGIRFAHVFLQSTDSLDSWEAYKYSNPTEYARRTALVAQYRAESKFLIAFFYFELVKRYGGVPLVKEAIAKDTEWTGQYPRRAFASCIAYISELCDTAANNLPATYDAGNYGRATQGAAMALKARALLYAASDLYNQPGNADSLRGYTGGDRQQRWIDAAIANKAVMDLTPKYTFHATYEALSLLGSALSKEVIFERRYTASNIFEKQNTGIGFQGGLTGTCPSGNLADAYEHLDDGRFDWNNPAHAANPYSRRDPRMAKTIVVNNSTFGKQKLPVELWTGGVNGKPRDRASKTGYYLRKYINENLDLQLNETSTKQWIFMRLSEISLNYAEAMNEAYGPNTTGPGTLSLTATAALNSVRTRAAVKLPAVGAADQATLRSRIRNERRVELAFEGHRYWDVRRWMIAGQAIGGTITGVNITRNADGSFTYQPATVETRVWNDKLYFYPIPQSEITVSHNVITQNKGW